jgi:hypothetical protein
MSERPSLASQIPEWARDFFNDWITPDPARPAKILIDDELPHRREAFYRLFCTQSADMQSMWTQADRRIREECELRGWQLDPEYRYFLWRIILLTDATVPPEKYPFDRRAQKGDPTRLRDPAQNLARKLACQMRELWHIAPTRTISGVPLVKHWPGPIIDALAAGFCFRMPVVDYHSAYGVFQRNNIEFTQTSKRGWVEHARAAERLRIKISTNANSLVDKYGLRIPASIRLELNEYVRALDNAPLLEDIAAVEVELASQKASWADWLRTIHARYAEDGELGNILRYCDWAAIATALFPDTFGHKRPCTDDDIRKIVGTS